MKLTPDRAGTPERPQPVRMAVDLRVDADKDAESTPVQSVELTVPAGVVFRADALESCAVEALKQDGPEGCPRASRLGAGTVRAGAEAFTVDGEVTAFFGGEDRIALWVSISNPVVVGAAITGRLAAEEQGGYRLALDIPEELQNVAGLPVSLESLKLSLDPQGGFATTDCSDGGLPFAATLGFGGDQTAQATVKAACR